MVYEGVRLRIIPQSPFCSVMTHDFYAIILFLTKFSVWLWVIFIKYEMTIHVKF